MMKFKKKRIKDAPKQPINKLDPAKLKTVQGGVIIIDDMIGF